MKIEEQNNASHGKLWDTLTEDQKNEVLLAYEESFDKKNLISHDEVMKQHKQWLNTPS